ncbi:MAG: ABC transporter permease [Bacteroidota bacterium]
MQAALTDTGRAIRSQALRLRRSGVWLPTLGIPSVAIALAAIVLWSAEPAAVPEADLWAQIIQAAFGMWALLLLPLLTALVAAQVAALEHGARAWKHLLALPTWKGAHIVAAWVAVAGLTAAATLALATGIAVVGAITAMLQPLAAPTGAPLAKLFGAAGLVYAGSLLLVSGHLWLSIRWPGVGVGLAVAVVGVFSNIVLLNLGAGAVTPYGLAPSALIGGRLDLVLISFLGGLAVLIASVWYLSQRDAPA